MSPKANAAKVLLLGKVSEARKMQDKFLRIKRHLSELRDSRDDFVVTEEHLEAILKLFVLGAISHNLHTLLWLYNFTANLKHELGQHILREHRIDHQIDRLLNLGDRINEKYEPLMLEIIQLEKTIQRG